MADVRSSCLNFKHGTVRWTVNPIIYSENWTVVSTLALLDQKFKTPLGAFGTLTEMYGNL